MIAIDSNVLLRYLLNDDLAHAAAAERLITGEEKVLITDAVLVEVFWTLRGKKYRLKKPTLVSVIETLFEESNIRFENSKVVWLALNDYRKAERVGGKDADFADSLIIHKAKAIIGDQGNTFMGFYTFDAAAQALPGAKAPQ